jgi:formylglycine-generating enzyme required for sulfatase activity
VGRFRPNAFGLYDMLGNALAWTEDCYQNSYDGAPPDGAARTLCVGPMSDQKIMRGTGWDGAPAETQSRQVEEMQRSATLTRITILSRYR